MMRALVFTMEVARGAWPGDMPKITKGMDFSIAVWKQIKRTSDMHDVQMAEARCIAFGE